MTTAIDRVVRDGAGAPFPAAFLSTVFLAAPPPGGWPPAFAVVTAFNPHARPASAAANRNASRRLQAELAASGLVHFPVAGCSSDLDHREDGFGVAGIGLEEAWRLAARHGQLAFFWVEGDVVHVCVDASGTGWHAGRWSRRLRKG